MKLFLLFYFNLDVMAYFVPPAQYPAPQHAQQRGFRKGQCKYKYQLMLSIEPIIFVKMLNLIKFNFKLKFFFKQYQLHLKCK